MRAQLARVGVGGPDIPRRAAPQSRAALADLACCATPRSAPATRCTGRAHARARRDVFGAFHSGSRAACRHPPKPRGRPSQSRARDATIPGACRRCSPASRPTGRPYAHSRRQRRRAARRPAVPEPPGGPRVASTSSRSRLDPRRERRTTPARPRWYVSVPRAALTGVGLRAEALGHGCIRCCPTCRPTASWCATAAASGTIGAGGQSALCVAARASAGRRCRHRRGQSRLGRANALLAPAWTPSSRLETAPSLAREPPESRHHEHRLHPNTRRHALARRQGFPSLLRPADGLRSGHACRSRDLFARANARQPKWA